MNFRQTLDIHLNSIQKHDLEAYISTLHPEKIILVLPNGTLISDRNAVIDMHKQWFAETKWKFKYSIVTIEEKKEHAYVLLDIDYSDETDKGEPIQLYFYLSLVFEKINDAWFLAYDQNTIQKK